MNITLDKLVQSESALQYLSTKELSIKNAYHIARLIDTVTAETKQYHEKRNELIQKLGAERDTTQAEKDNNMGDKTTEVLAENMEDFKSQIAELDAIPVTIDKWLLKTEMFSDVKVAGWAIRALGELITE